MKKSFWLFSFIFLSVLSFLASSQAFTRILTNTSPNHTIISGSYERVLGTSSSSQITIESGAGAELFHFPGQNTIQMQSNSELFIVSRSGAFVTFQGSDGTVLKIPATADIQIISFSDRSLALRIYSNQVMLDDQIITTVSSPIAFPGQLLTTETIGSEGGTLAVDEFALVIPRGFFPGPENLSLYKMGKSRDFEIEMVTPTFRLAGLPQDLSDTLFPDLRHTSTISDESYIVIGEEVFIPSRSIPGMAYHMVPAAPLAERSLCGLGGRKIFI